MINKTLTILFLGLLLLATSCKAQYPDLEDGLYAEFVTNKGTMVAKLFYEEAPVTVANFVALAEGNHPMVKEEFKGKRYYDGLTFHRVMNNFMIQGGDPTATGTGDPGYKFPDEFYPDFKHNKPGIISMANPGPNSNGSQFFITEKATPWLDNRHAIFGELVLGLDIQDSISNVKVVDKKTNKPVEDVIIEKLNIIRKGSAAKAFNAPKVFTDEMPKIEERQKAIKEKAKKEAEEKVNLAKEEFLKKNENLEGRVLKSPTGLAMIYTHEANGVKPKSTDKVLISYAGYFENGELFDTNLKDVAEKYGKYDQRRDEQNGYKPFSMIYNKTAGLAAGFREAMLNMNIGDKARIFVPYYLGYGEQGRGPIPPKANLIFDLEIVGIDK